MNAKAAVRSRRDAPEGDAPSPFRALVMWAIIAKGGEAAQKEIRPALDKANRDHLVNEGLLRAHKGPRNAIRLEVTDAGWHWARHTTGAALSERANGTPVLADLLTRLGTFMASGAATLAEIIHPRAASAETASEADDLEQRIRAAYFELTGGAYARRVRLTDLRARLAAVPRAALDAALIAMAETTRANLMPLDDPAEIRPADAAAALHIGPFTRHILWIDA